jgi:TPR repeat protein
MSQAADRLEGYRRLSESGDPDAQIALAWEYVKGELVDKNMDAAVRLFREAEQKKPSIARFNLAKAKIMMGDSSFKKDLLADCEAGFGPALYLLGIAEQKGVFQVPHPGTALEYFDLAAANGHLVSKFLLWRLAPKGWLKWLLMLPGALGLLLRISMVKYQDPNNPQVLT